MEVRAIKTKLFKEGDDLTAFVQKYIPKLKERSVVVVTVKIVSLSEGRTAPTTGRTRLIRSESVHAIKTKHVWLTIKDGALMANAGIDDSNANGKLILLPKNCMRTAQKLRAVLRAAYKVRNLGVIINDSNPVPLRAGVVGVALGYAGFKAVRDYRGKKDLFGRKFIFSQTNVADSLATVANLTMGEGDERQPLVVITQAPVVFTNRTTKNELRVDPKIDMYAPLLKPLLKKKRRS